MANRLDDAYTEILGSLTKFSTEAAEIFHSANWKWAMVGGMRAPSPSEVLHTASDLAWDAYEAAKRDGNAGAVSGGRIQVRFVHYGNYWVGTIELVACAKTSSI